MLHETNTDDCVVEFDANTTGVQLRTTSGNRRMKTLTKHQQNVPIQTEN